MGDLRFSRQWRFRSWSFVLWHHCLGGSCCLHHPQDGGSMVTKV